jgi:AraC family transcriptional regulator
VIERIAQCIANEEAPPTIGVLAHWANLSEFHFMRIYRALAGESLGATIQRLRLGRAIHLLASTSLPVSEIAGRVGYETPQAFARAFRQMFDATPSDVRDRPASFLLAAAAPRETTTDRLPPVIRVEIVDLHPFTVAAMRNHGDYADLDEAYGRLFNWVAKQGALESVQGIWGVPHHDRRDTPIQECVFDCCLSTSATLVGDDAVRIGKLGGGRYATYLQIGSYALLDDAHDALLRDALPLQGLALRDEPILHRFANDPDNTPEAELETHIYIPIEPEVLS